MFFLINFAKLHAKIDVELQNIVQERSIFECYNIFVKLFYITGNISKRDLNLYEEIYNLLIKNVFRKPDLVLYLTASPQTILNRINTRKRDFEKNISLAFIKQQDELYQKWIIGEKEIKVIKINTDRLNFVKNKTDLQEIIDMIELGKIK
jgi:deoxyadenosine/deoxycytidine kinase